MQSPRQLETNAGNGAENVFRLRRSTKTLKVGPSTCCRHFGDRGRYSLPNVRNAIERLDPALSQKLFYAVIERGNAVRGLPVGPGPEWIVLLRRKKIGCLPQPCGHKFIDRKRRSKSFNWLCHRFILLVFT